MKATMIILDDMITAIIKLFGWEVMNTFTLIVIIKQSEVMMNLGEELSVVMIMIGEKMKVIVEIEEDMRVIDEIEEEELIGGMMIAMRIVISEDIMQVKYWNQ